ncbi:MAG: hypothetical protein VKP72_00260 [bacterium]|nr:hypothetical protein [bacterium]
MPNALDRFSQVYNQVRPQPPVSSGGAPVQVAPSPVNQPQPSSIYIPDPRRTQLPAQTQAPWNNPNYPAPSPATPPFVPPTSSGYPATPPVQYPGMAPTTFPVGLPSTYPGGYPSTYPGGYPSNYPGSNPYGYPAVGPLTTMLGSLTPVVKDQGYQKFVRETAPIIDTAIPLIGTIVGLIGSTRRSSSPAGPQGTAPAAPTPAPIFPTIPQQTYPQPSPFPTYPGQPTYPQPVPASGNVYGTTTGLAWPGSGPTIQIGGSNLGEGIQQVGNLVNSISNLFR